MSDFRPAKSIEPSSFRGESGLDEESLIAIQSTLGVVSSLSSNGDSISFSPSSFTLHPSSPNSLSESTTPSSKTLSFLRNLLLSTTKAAVLNSSSSYLAGPSNESDEYGDVALYLCPSSASSTTSLGKEGSEREILSLMGLESILSKEAISIKPYSIPKSSHSEYVDQLEDKYAFRVEGATDGGTVLFFLVGRYESDWVGLLGVGVWS